MLNKIFKRGRQKKSILPYTGSCYDSGQYFEMWSGRDYSSFAEKAYIKNVIASRAINIVAVAASSVPIQLFELKGTERKLRLHSHPLNLLLNEPSPNMSRVTLIKNAVTYKLISGNIFLLKVSEGFPKELHLLRPDRVTVFTRNGYYPSGL